MTLTKDRQQFILDKLGEGFSGAGIGRQLGISRQRVSELAERYHAERKVPDGYLTVAEFADRVGYSDKIIYKLIKAGRAPAIKPSECYYIPISAVFERQCAICDSPLLKGKRVYCSEKCSLVGWKKSQNRLSFRRLYKQQGKPIPPHLAKRRSQSGR